MAVNLLKKKNRKYALLAINEYFDKASAIFDLDRVKANEYVRKARRLAMKHRVRLDVTKKRSFCKHCYSFLKPGRNLRVRTREGHVVLYCMECKSTTRVRYKF